MKKIGNWYINFHNFSYKFGKAGTYLNKIVWLLFCSSVYPLI